MWLAWLFLGLLVCVVGLWGYINFAGLYRHSLEHELVMGQGLGAAQGFGTVAVICPGRNEAEHIRLTLPELCGQDLAGTRVVYVDDASEDQTPLITSAMDRRFAQLTVVRVEGSPPAGWVGKCWAVHKGYEWLCQMERGSEAGRAEWVCFTDADIHWHPSLLGHAAAYAQQTGADVVALFPRLTFGSAIEAMVQAEMVLALGILFPFEKAMDPDHPDTLTGGAFMLVRRSLYEKIGGHEAVKGHVVEDINLGRALKAAGGTIAVAVAPQLLWCRMYEGWSDMWEGLTKNAFAGLEYSLVRAMGMFAAAGLANVLPPVYVVIAAIWVAVSPGWMSAVALGLSILTVLLPARALNVVRKMLDLPWWHAFSMPIGAGIYLVITGASVWRYFRGGNRWKGRSYGRATRTGEEEGMQNPGQSQSRH